MGMTQTRRPRPAVLDSVDDLDPFATPATVDVLASQLREGMVLVDPILGTPAFWIDQKLRAEARSGSVKLNVWDLEDNRFQTNFRVTANALVAVVAA